MRHRMGNVEEEGLLRGVLDELHGPLGDGAGERGLIRERLDGADLGRSLDDRKGRVVLLRGRVAGVVNGPHVVGIRNAPVHVKAAASGKELFRITQMPLAQRAGCIPGLLAKRRERLFPGLETDRAARKEHVRQADAIGVATGEERRTRWRARAVRNAQRSESQPFLGHRIEIRRGVLPAVAAKIAIAHVIGEDDDEIGRW